jgi:hypothetical protein
MSKFDLFKKKCEINYYQKALCSIYDSDFGCRVDIEPVPNPVVFAEYVWIKFLVKIDEEEDMSKGKK